MKQETAAIMGLHHNYDVKSDRNKFK